MPTLPPPAAARTWKQWPLGCDLYKQLVAEAAYHHAAEHGPLTSPIALHDRLTRHPPFQRLYPLSAQMAELDEMLDDPEGPTLPEALTVQRRFK